MRRQNLTRRVALSALISSVVMMPGCDLTQNYAKMDRTSNAQFQEYRDALSPREMPPAQPQTNIPPLEPYVADVPDTLKAMPLVSVSVNQSIPLRDVLYELAKQADYDIELDPKISGSVIFTARNRPFDQVIDRISELAGLRYTFNNDVLRVELDTPYNVNYKVDYLTAVRSNNSGLQTSVSVVSGGGTNAGSNFNITSQAENNFWGELEASLSALLKSNNTQTQLRTTQDPQLNVSTAQNVSTARDEPPPPPAGAATGAAGTEVAVNAAAPVPTPIIQVAESAPVIESAAADGAASAAQEASFSMNKSAGIITVFANQRLQREVESYISEIKKQMSSQVLIEAKVLEVSLTDEFSTGIDWSQLNMFNGRLSTGIRFPGPGLTGFDNSSASTGVFTLDLSTGGTSALIKAISRFGTVRALASPRVTVLNNQPAVLNVAKNQVYFEISVEATTETIGNNTQRVITPDAEIRTVPIGVLINVLPVIDLEKQTVTMQVRPTISRIDSKVSDPSVAFYVASANNSSLDDLKNEIPVVGVQEMDSVVKMNSGETLVMGGLLQDQTRSIREGVPVLGELPGIGAAFRSQGDEVTKSELVILLKSTILKDGGLTQADKDLYRVFGQDRRPLGGM